VAARIDESRIVTRAFLAGRVGATRLEPSIEAVQ
jgi:hypothetical protein